MDSVPLQPVYKDMQNQRKLYYLEESVIGGTD